MLDASHVRTVRAADGGRGGCLVPSRSARVHLFADVVSDLVGEVLRHRELIRHRSGDAPGNRGSSKDGLSTIRRTAGGVGWALERPALEAVGIQQSLTPGKPTRYRRGWRAIAQGAG